MIDHTDANFCPRLALVGDHSPDVRAHLRIPAILNALKRHDQIEVHSHWLPTGEVATRSDLADFDGIWLMPGSPYRSEAGALAAVQAARTIGVPFLGTCGGFQHAVLEFARNVCGIADAAHAESDPDGSRPVISLLAAPLVGQKAQVRVVPGSLAERVLGAGYTFERYQARYGTDLDHLDLLTRHGLRFTGHDDNGEPRMLELPEHPFFLATLFQPELRGAEGEPAHPVIRAFAAAMTAHHRSRVAPAS